MTAAFLDRNACHRSQSCCNPTQKSAFIPVTQANRSAVSGVTARLPRMISLRRGNDTPERTAKADCEMPSGSGNSSRSISPGCVGGRRVGSFRTPSRFVGAASLPTVPRRRGRPPRVPLGDLLAALTYHVVQGTGTVTEHFTPLFGTALADSSWSDRRQRLPWEMFAELMRRVLRPRATAAGATKAQTRPQLPAKPRRRGFAQRPPPSSFFLIPRPDRKDSD